MSKRFVINLEQEVLVKAAQYVSNDLGLGNLIVQLDQFTDTEPNTVGFTIRDDKYDNRIFLCVDNIMGITNELVEEGHIAVDKVWIYYTGTIVETILHEFRHVWQHRKGLPTDHHMDYNIRPSEVDARNYAKDNMQQCIDYIFNDDDSINNPIRVGITGSGIKYFEDIKEDEGIAI